MLKAMKKFVPQSAVDASYALKYGMSRLPVYQEYRAAVEGKSGIEIGGPSTLFKTVLPLYQAVQMLDGVNFATDTSGKVASPPATLSSIITRRPVINSSPTQRI